MDTATIQQAFDIANRAQHLHNVTVSAEKYAAKLRASEIVKDHLNLIGKTDHAVRILDIGGEDFYVEHFPAMEQMNLPNDMHNLSAVSVYDTILAMHVLEHSPFPLLVLLNIRRALKPDGFVYVAVPRPVQPFLTLPSHFTVLDKLGWEKLFGHAGLKVTFAESGRFGDYDPAVEERYVCIRGQ